MTQIIIKSNPLKVTLTLVLIPPLTLIGKNPYGPFNLLGTSAPKTPKNFRSSSERGEQVSIHGFVGAGFRPAFATVGRRETGLNFSKTTNAKRFLALVTL